MAQQATIGIDVPAPLDLGKNTPGGRRFKCGWPNCSYTTDRRNDCKRHYKSTHLDIRPLECDTCHRRFHNRSQFETHLRTHSKEKPHHCRVCLANGTIVSFADVSACRRHETKVHGYDVRRDKNPQVVERTRMRKMAASNATPVVQQPPLAQGSTSSSTNQLNQETLLAELHAAFPNATSATNGQDEPAQLPNQPNSGTHYMDNNQDDPAQPPNQPNSGPYYVDSNRDAPICSPNQPNTDSYAVGEVPVLNTNDQYSQDLTWQCQPPMEREEIYNCFQQLPGSVASHCAQPNIQTYQPPALGNNSFPPTQGFSNSQQQTFISNAYEHYSSNPRAQSSSPYFGNMLRTTLTAYHHFNPGTGFVYNFAPVYPSPASISAAINPQNNMNKKNFENPCVTDPNKIDPALKEPSQINPPVYDQAAALCDANANLEPQLNGNSLNTEQASSTEQQSNQTFQPPLEADFTTTQNEEFTQQHSNHDFSQQYSNEGFSQQQPYEDFPQQQTNQQQSNEDFSQQQFNEGEASNALQNNDTVNAVQDSNEGEASNALQNNDTVNAVQQSTQGTGQNGLHSNNTTTQPAPVATPTTGLTISQQLRRMVLSEGEGRWIPWLDIISWNKLFAAGAGTT